jgi:hypothetical protein
MEELNRRPTFLLRLPVSVRDEAARLAYEDGTSLNHFISIAVAEKLARIEASVAHGVTKQKPLQHAGHH